MENLIDFITILPEDYEPRGGIEVGGTGAGCVEIYRDTLQDFDSPDTISFRIESGLFEYTNLSVSVTGNWLTNDVVCPPEDEESWRLYMIARVYHTV